MIMAKFPMIFMAMIASLHRLVHFLIRPVRIARKINYTHIILVFLSGKTVNSYRQNHDIMGMFPIPPKAVERC
jgi:hypothetical protein